MTINTRTGVWLVGGRGSVATTAVVGAAALRAGLVSPTGCVSELPEFQRCGLPAFEDLVFGGHDVVESDPVKRAELLAVAGVLPPGLPTLVHEDLVVADAEFRMGTPSGPGGCQADTVDRLTADLADFRRRHGLARVVVINLSVTEPRAVPHPAHSTWPLLQAALQREEDPVLPCSALYACAAMLAGCSFADFTPSTGARLPALDELSQQRGVSYAGSDGKTGETLLKSVLGVMFARRALRVRSWSGTNLLGGGDGATLTEPGRAASKAASKSLVLAGTLGYPVEGGVHIHHIPDLGEWKTAWDHIGFEGFLGVRMTMQFTWQGCDSALAAPLVLDLARFLALARTGGAVPALGFFFKDPVGGTAHGLDRQFADLVRWATDTTR